MKHFSLAIAMACFVCFASALHGQSVMGTYETSPKSILIPEEEYIIDSINFYYSSFRNYNSARSTYGIYTFQDSTLRVLVYLSIAQDLNVGGTDFSTKQYYRTIKVYKNKNDSIFLARPSQYQPALVVNEDSVMVTNNIEIKTTTRKISNNSQQPSASVTDCIGYGNHDRSFKDFLNIDGDNRQQKRIAKSERKVHQKFTKFINETLRDDLGQLPVSHSHRGQGNVRMLFHFDPAMKSNLPKVIIPHNSTLIPDSAYLKAAQQFLQETKLRSDRLREILLIQMFVNNDTICVLPNH